MEAGAAATNGSRSAATTASAPSGTGAEASGGEDTSMMAWSLGLAEVALPISFKIKNIEETEKARRKLEEGRAANRAAARQQQLGYGAQGLASSAYEAVGAAVSTSTASSSSSSSSSSLLAAARFWPAHLQMKKNEEREKQKEESVDVLQGPMPETAPIVSANEFGGSAPTVDDRKQNQPNSWGQRQGAGGRGGRRISNDDYVLNKYKKASFR